MSELFVEVGHRMVQKSGNEICGDVFLSRKVSAEGRTIVVLSDGLGSGTKANILASMTASMALNFTLSNSPAEHAARIILKTLPVDSFRKISYSTFTIVDMDGEGVVNLVEFGNPSIVIWSRGKLRIPEKTKIVLDGVLVKQHLFTSRFTIEKGDRIVLCSDGITQSGMGTDRMPFGWGSPDMMNFVGQKIEADHTISAGDLSDLILGKALENDAQTALDDMTCGIIFPREPRRLLVCTGPPYKRDHDRELAERVRSFGGKVLVCGGTTALILARELNREINMKLDGPTDGLPPAASMEGIALVTEGILTIGRVAEYLDSDNSGKKTASGPAQEILKLFRDHDEIIFLVGTRVNEAHQDPALPVELEIRRSVIKRIAASLENKYLKKTNITYI